MTNKFKYNYYALQETEEVLYDKYDMRVARILWFILGFCASFILICITFYLTDLYAK